MKFLRLYIRVLEMLGREARLGLDARARQSGDRRRACSSSRCCSDASSICWRTRRAGSRQLNWQRTAAAGSAPGSASRCSSSSAARWWRCTPTASPTANTRWCGPMFFEHVLQLPLSYHTGSHSGRLMKVMITGTNTLWGTVAVVLPRTLRELRLAARAAAADAVRELALRLAADRAVRRVRDADRAGRQQEPRRCKARSRATTATWPSAPPTRSVTSPWSRASPASNRKWRA